MGLKYRETLKNLWYVYVSEKAIIGFYVKKLKYCLSIKHFSGTLYLRLEKDTSQETRKKGKMTLKFTFLK